MSISGALEDEPVVANYIIVDSKESLNLDTLNEVSLNSEIGISFLVVRDELLCDPVIDWAKNKNIQLLCILPKWRQRMQKYLPSPSIYEYFSDYEVALMAVFITADLERVWSVQRLGQGSHALSLIEVLWPLQPSKSVPKLMLCSRQPCSCAHDYRQQLRRVSTVAKSHGVRVITSECQGDCSVLGSGQLIKKDGQAVSAKHLFGWSDKKLERFFINEKK